MTLAIIGGTGLEDAAGQLTDKKQKTVSTPYGETSLIYGSIDKTPIIFLARHGHGHGIAPHLINYRANIWALKDAGATHIMATAAVGSLKRDIRPGDFILIDQFIDFTKNRASTFWEAGQPVRHTDMTEPYDGTMGRLITAAAEDKGARLHRVGTYVCTEGPRFETAAEINMFINAGASVVGMTGVPEVVLANEVEMPYAALAVATNYAAGLAGHSLTYEECAEEMEKWQATILDIFLKAAKAGDLI